MAQEFVPGQVWTYKHAEPQSSRVIIGKVDRFDGQEEAVISILVTDAPIPITHSTHQTIPHAPVGEKSLRESLIALEGETQIPSEFMVGYRQWRQVFDQGKAGYFTIPVDKIVEYIGRAMSQSSTVQ